MFKLLIVDDEEYIREGLRILLEWEEYGIEIIGDVSNGKDAFDFLLKNNPDIVICDVRMPVMTGVEFVQKVREAGMDTRILILSGYDDFNYVKQAIKYGVENYLLKPIDECELKQTIEQIIEKLEKESKEKSFSHEGKLVLKNNLLTRLANETISFKEFREKAEMSELDILDSKLQAAIIDVNLNRILNHGLEEKVYDLCSKLISDKSAVVFIDHQRNVVIIFIEKEKVITKEAVNTTLNVIYREIVNRFGLSPIVSVGDKAVNYQHLHISYRHALDIHEYRIVKTGGHILYFEDIVKRREESKRNIDIDYNYIEECVEQCRPEKLIEYIDEIFQSFTNYLNLSFGYIYSIAIEIAVTVFRKVRKEGGHISDLIDNEEDFIRKAIFQKTYDDLRDWLVELIRISFKQLESILQNKYSNFIAEVIKYVNSNYQQEISLKTISAVMYCHPSYLGRVFKKETGEVFSDYLNRIRNEKAKGLLLNTNKKANDIAREVGFTNINYFYSVFKKYTGMTPTDFRNS